MRGKRYICWLVGVLLFIGCSDRNMPEKPLQVRECASIPTPRACAAACSLDGKGYIFGGRTQDGQPTRDIWQYDPQTDAWTQINTFPGPARINGVIIAHNDALYMGLGFSKGVVYVDSCYLRDWWRYTPADGQWKALTPSPTTNTIHGVPYVSGNRLYILYSTGWSHTNDIIYYDVTTDRWETVSPHAGRVAPLFAPAGAQCAGRYFFGTGYNWKNRNQWFEIDLANEDWRAVASLPAKGRMLCASAATDRHIYLFGGRTFAGEHTGGEVFEEYWRYSAADNRWEWCGAMPFGRGENMIAFTIDNRVYFGLGENEKGILYEKLYCIDP